MYIYYSKRYGDQDNIPIMIDEAILKYKSLPDNAMVMYNESER